MDDAAFTTPVAAAGNHEVEFTARLLGYERQIVEELIDHDALCVMGCGLGWHKVVSVFIRMFGQQPPGVLLILGCSPAQRKLIKRELRRHDAETPLPIEINSEVAALERVEQYRSRACCFITTRILVVDLLSSRVLPSSIAGIVVVNAHRVTDTSGEGFAIRLYRQGNRQGFVRAFSDQPTAFAAGFNRVEKVLKALRVRRLTLWPRFQQRVKDELDRHVAHLVEWEQELTPPMMAIQESVLQLLTALIKELQKGNKIDTSDLKPEEALHRPLDRAVRQQLDAIWHTISWKTKQIVKDLSMVQSLATFLLRYDAVTFLAYLEDLKQSEGARSVWLFHDAAHTIFEQARQRVYRLQLPIVAANGGATGATAAPGGSGGGGGRGKKRKASGQAAAQAAGKRKVTSGKAQPLSAAGVVGDGDKPPILEEPPKWQLLRDVLEEVQQLRRKWREADLDSFPEVLPIDPTATQHAQHSPFAAAAADAAEEDVELIDLVSQEGDEGGGATAGTQGPPLRPISRAAARKLQAAAAGPVLVVARELHMCGQLECVLRQGGRAVMQQLYENYLLSKLNKPKHKDRRMPRGARHRRGHDPERERLESMHAALTSGGGPGGLRPEEQQALVDEARRISKAAAQAQEPTAGKSGGRKATAGGRGGRGRGRGRGRGGRGKAKLGNESPVQQEQHLQEVEDDEGQHAFDTDGADSGSSDSRSGSDDEDVRPDEENADALAARRASCSNAGSRGNPAADEVPLTSRTDSTRQPPAAASSANAQPTTSRATATNRKQQLNRGNKTGQAAASSGPAPSGLAAAATAVATDAAPCPLLDDVHFHALDSQEDFALWELQPSFLVLYDPDVVFVRQVELYKAERPGCPMLVYNLYYGDSLDKQQYVASVVREQDVFASLIDAKQHLVLPADMDSQQLIPAAPRPTGVNADMWLDVYSQNQLTRTAGGRASRKVVPRRVVVDMREFMSHLPAVLHQQGFDLTPLTLEVGDYVLSPEICVERKSVPDLIGSLASGRLYNQAEAMTRHYKTPVLLIEFDQDRAFALQAPSEIGEEIDSRSIMSRLTLLLLHFPKLRLVWSRSLHATADIFLSLKSNQDEPDAATAALVGVPLGADGQPLQGSAEAVVNQSAVELLRRLPGVNDSNYRALMNACSSLAELADKTYDELRAVMGSDKNAKVLREFLDAPCVRL